MNAYPNLKRLIEDAEPSDQVRVLMTFDKGVFNAECRSYNGLGESFPMFDALEGERALVGRGPSPETALRALDALCVYPNSDLNSWKHIANEYADAATNGLQWLKNVRDGFSTTAEGIAEMEGNLKRIAALPKEQS